MPTEDERQHVRSLKHPRLVAGCEVDGVEQPIKGCVHVDTGRALRLVGRKPLPVTISVAAFVCDDEGMSVPGNRYGVCPLKDVLKADLLRGEVNPVDRTFALQRHTRHVWVQLAGPQQPPIQGYILEWRRHSPMPN